jgi:DNA replicative helicase MCM subunit Mcm2 (Cdc46/Mcm family)
MHLSKPDAVRGRPRHRPNSPAGLCRSMTVHVKGDLTRTMKPGDHVVVTGAYLPQPILKRGRHATHTQLQGTVLHATDVTQLKESYAEHVITEAVRPAPNNLVIDLYTAC